VRDGRWKSGKIKIDVIADQVVERGPSTFVGNMGQIVVKLQFEKFTRKMAGGANARGRESHFRLGLQSCEELRQS
jgi:hypothetical protein